MKQLKKEEYKNFFIWHVILPYQTLILEGDSPAKFSEALYKRLPEFLTNAEWEEKTMTRLSQVFSRVEASVFPQCKETTCLLASMHLWGVNVVYS